MLGKGRIKWKDGHQDKVVSNWKRGSRLWVHVVGEEQRKGLVCRLVHWEFGFQCRKRFWWQHVTYWRRWKKVSYGVIGLGKGIGGGGGKDLGQRAGIGALGRTTERAGNRVNNDSVTGAVEAQWNTERVASPRASWNSSRLTSAVPLLPNSHESSGHNSWLKSPDIMMLAHGVKGDRRYEATARTTKNI